MSAAVAEPPDAIHDQQPQTEHRAERGQQGQRGSLSRAFLT